MLETTIKTATLAQTEQSAQQVAMRLTAPMRLFLSGDLGAGKTSWARALLRAMGETGTIPSPSYALANTYHTDRLVVHHLDCFRLQGGAIDDDLLELINDEALCLVEWPEKTANLPPPDLWIYFDFAGDSARNLRFIAANDMAENAVRQLAV